VTTDPVHLIVAGESVTVRSIRADDTLMEGEFVHNLSLETKHYRFFCGVKELLPAELKGLCTVDGRSSMAFVATVPRDGHETQIGVSRYVSSSKEDVREMAVTIADEWQHKGLGLLLVNHLTTYAKSHGVKQLYSVDLADNSAMRELARELGMSASRDPEDAHQVIYSLTL
jgi:GNAT superfamily N-acetyltransferase